MGRALAELSLVRLSLLEETLELASLVEQLRGEPSETGAKSSATSSRAPSHARSLKTPDTPVNRPAVPPSKPAAPLAEPQDQVSGVTASPCPPFGPSHADAIWAQIASRIDVRDFLGGAIAKVSRAAISGPNQLEIFFPSAYHANKRHCEQPAALGRLEKIASEVAGKPVRVVCELEADGPKPAQSEGITPETAPTRAIAGKAENGRQEQANVTDPYVERARTIFGATIENVSIANHRSAHGTSDESQAAPES